MSREFRISSDFYKRTTVVLERQGDGWKGAKRSAANY